MTDNRIALVGKGRLLRMVHEASERLEREKDLRAKSDALLKRCGWSPHPDSPRHWRNPHGGAIDKYYRPHPYANAQDAIDLAEAMGLVVSALIYSRGGIGYAATVMDETGRMIDGDWHPTIAEAICAAIEEAVK